MSVTRRQVLRYGAVGAAGAAATVLGGAALASAFSSRSDLAVVNHHEALAASVSQVAPELIPRRYAHVLPTVPRLVPFATGVDGDGPFEKYQVRTQAFNTRILGGGLLTPQIGYNGLAPGPTIEIERGTRAELTVRNHLPATHPTFGHPMELATHLHGSASLPQFDGYAADLTAPGMMKTYHYPNHQAARTLWYHDHAQHVTAENVYSGLAAHYHIHDEEERALLPQGEFDVALTVDDAQFAADGRLMFDHRENSGVWGDVIIMNGAPWPVMRVEPRIYRFRLLNICVSRSFRFRLSNGMPVTFVATDGGLMPRSRQALSWRHAPAERYEFLIDFRGFAGRRIELLNSSNDNNRDFDFTDKVMAFDVLPVPPTTTKPDGSPDPTWNTIPGDLATGNAVMALDPAAAVRERRFRVQRNNATNIWTLGELSWFDIVDSGYQRVMADPGLGDTEIWELTGGDGWFHPVHIHLVDFKVLTRNGAPAFDYEQGPKDTVYIGENESVRVLMNFGPHTGRYMVHCHNLTHEDHAMMTQFSVGLQAGDPDPNDPINAARPVPDADPSLA